MTRHIDEFSKSLANSCSRRESLRVFGAFVAGAVLSSLPLSSAWAATSSTCKNFCNRCPKRLRSQCLSACQACGGKTNRLCGSCGSYACCGAGTSCCGNYCTDLSSDFDNCGACGNVCTPGPYEDGACIAGQCEYVCTSGAVRCNGVCTFLDSDPNNCGACGNRCPESAPDCDGGICHESTCHGYCPEGWCGGDGCGGACGCPEGWYCDSNWCYPG